MNTRKPFQFGGATTTHDAAIHAFLTTPAYHDACLVLVHPEIRKLEDAADELVSVYGWLRLPIGRELSAVLVAEAHRTHAARQWLGTRLAQMAPGPVLCMEIDVLFEPTLKLDPLGLLRQFSRVTKLIVTWPGTYINDVLAYAVPEHSHYRTWRQPGIPVVVLE